MHRQLPGFSGETLIATGWKRVEFLRMSDLTWKHQLLAFFLIFLSVGYGQESKTDVPAVRFDPVIQQIEGWTVHIEPSLLPGGEHRETGEEAIKMLTFHLHFIALLAPKDRLAKLRKCEIWLEHHHPTLGAMQYHPGVDWLIKHGHDPRLVKKVHITRARHLFEKEQLLKHPMVILHELAHAYHDQVLGFEEPRIKAAYDRAREAGSYKNTLLYNGKRVLHYGMTNHKEYFAEGTEAYFNRNDFYPFVRAELQEHDRDLHDLLEEIWGALR